ncbi:MAG: peptide-N4-asparagine amidase, partial [Thermoplasmata archaeon]
MSETEHHTRVGSRIKRRSYVVLAFLVAVMFTTPQASLSSEEQPLPSSEGQINDINSVQYVNFTNPSSNWTATFTNVSFPQGSWESITLTLKLVNLGDPWDRANVVGVNSVMILEMTTKENASVLRNPVQIYTKNVTVYASLFNASAEVYWSAMSNYQDGWFCELSFAFFPGTPPMLPPEVVPAIFHTTLSTSNTTSVNVTFPPNITSAKAVLTEEGFSDEEFWFANVAPTVRDYTLDINNTRVFDITAYPYLNSGACLNPPNCFTLYEWNGTPPLGTGLRPQHFVDISPFVSLLNGTQTLTFSIGNGGSYWKVSLAFLVW